MMRLTTSDDADIEFYLWKEMKKYALEDLHNELISEHALRRFTSAKELHLRGESFTFEYAKLLCDSDIFSREIGAFILGQLGTPNRPFMASSIPILTRLLKFDIEPAVRSAAASALGHLASAQSLDTLVEAAKDIDSSVRGAVAFALGEVGGQGSIKPLLRLTYDEVTDVVEWALIGIGQLDFNTASIRDRYAELLDDPREEIFEEAIFGLVKWKDSRVLPALSKALTQESVSLDIIKAAGDFGVSG